jgi:enoyl-CoA hydratase/carnithine racemase
MSFNDIIVSQDDAVVTIQFNRAPVLHALRKQTFVELHEVFRSAAADDTVRVVVMTGTGRAFSAGADLNELATSLSNGAITDPEPHAEQVELTQSLTRAIATHPKITIAAINGVAVGYGAEIPLACDLRVASTNARFAFPEAKRGLCQTNGTLFFLERLIGLGRAKDVLLSGDPISAEDAYRIGLVSRLYPSEVFGQELQKLTRALAQAAPLTVRYVKQAMPSANSDQLESVLKLETNGTFEALASHDLIEGITAFHEKRHPKFTGR